MAGFSVGGLEFGPCYPNITNMHGGGAVEGKEASTCDTPAGRGRGVMFIRVMQGARATHNG